MSNDYIFQAFVVPCEIKEGKQRLSVCFELNTDHPVLKPVAGQAPTSQQITDWKTAVMNFPEMARAIHRNGALIQTGADDPIMLKAAGTDTDDGEATGFWAEFLGYKKLSEDKFEPRKKKRSGIGPAGDPDMSILSNTVPTQPMTITGHAVLKYFDQDKKNAIKNRARANFPESVATILERIEQSELLKISNTGILPANLTAGIQEAYQADQAINEKRFDKLIALSNYFEFSPHAHFNEENIGKLKAELNEKDLAEKLDGLKAFHRVAQTVLNEPAYIQEAVQKLGAILPVRRFTRTILDFEMPDGLLPTGYLQLAFFKSTEAVLAADFYAKATETIDCRFKTYIEHDQFLNSVIPAPINHEKYGQFYSHTLPKLSGKVEVATFESESVQRNFAQARDSLREQPELAKLKLVPSEFQKITALATKSAKTTAEWLELQPLQIILERLNKSAIKMQNRIANVQTVGHNFFITNTEWLGYDPNKHTRATPFDVFEHDLLNGYVVYQRIKEGDKIKADWASISRVNEYFGLANKISTFSTTDLAVGTDSFVNSLVVSDVAGQKPELKGINSGYLFKFDGITVSSRNPMKHYEREFEVEETRVSENMVEFAEQVRTSSPESTAVYLASKKLLSEDYFPLRKVPTSKYVVARELIFKKANDKRPPALKFSRTLKYQYLMAGQYLNGYSPVNEKFLNSATDDMLAEFMTEEAVFLRHDHIREVIVSFREDIYLPNTKKPKKDHMGETITDLVVRKGNLLDNEQSVRFLLPPPVPTFQTYLWYDFDQDDSFSRSRKLAPFRLFRYYNKYQCELKSQAEFDSAKPEKNACKQNCSTFCGGTAQPPVYKGELNYLPDPVVNGYFVRFFYDKELTQTASAYYPQQFCPMQPGDYPNLKHWTVKLLRKRRDMEYVKVIEAEQVLEVCVPDGRQVFAEIWPAYREDMACFSQELLHVETVKGCTEREMTFSPLHSSAVMLSFTSAIQRPLFAPQIISMNFNRYKKGAMQRNPAAVSGHLSLRFEHLENWNGIPVIGSQPTGDLELYGLWDDYSLQQEGPQKSITDKKKPKTDAEGFIFLGKIRFAQQGNSAEAYVEKMIPAEAADPDLALSTFIGELNFEFEPSFSIPYFSPSVYKVRNTSKFISYFEDVNALENELLNKELFSLWSGEFSASEHQFNPITYTELTGQVMASSNYLFNNLKPEAPVVEKIIPLIVRDDYPEGRRVSYYERIRIYYRPALTGKDNRLGILTLENAGIYRKHLEEYISRAGIDSVMDNFNDQLELNSGMLGARNFNLDGELLEEPYKRKLKPVYDTSFSTPDQLIGLVSYIPLYDAEQELWYVDLELDLKNLAGLDLHSPFVQLGLVNYQPHSANYALLKGSVEDNQVAFEDDFRLSDPIKADFFSIRPKRNFKNPFVLFKHRSADKFSFSGAISSLYFKDIEGGVKKLQSEFILCVQQQGHGDFWEVVPSKLFSKSYRLNHQPLETKDPDAELLYHPLLTGLQPHISSYTDQLFEIAFDIWFKKFPFGRHRIIIFEIECHNNLSLEHLPALLVNNELQQLNGVRIINNFIFSRKSSVKL